MDTDSETKMKVQQYNQNSSYDGLNTSYTSGWATKEYLSVTLVCLYVPFVVCSNACVVIAVLKFKRLQTPANYFVVSLAVADVFVGLALPVYIISDLKTTHSPCTFFNLVANRIMMTAAAVSVATLAIVSIDRYIAIAYSLEYIRMMTKPKIWACVLLSYVYSIIITWAPVLVGWYDLKAEKTVLCFGTMMNDYSRILFIVTVFLPSCGCVVFCYSKIARIARHHARAIEAVAVEVTFQQTLTRKIFNTDRKYAKTLAIVISIFMLTWTPYLILLTIQMTTSLHVNVWLKHYLTLLAFANSGVNPWVYAYKNTDFRAAFKNIIPIFGSRNRVTPVRRRSSAVSGVSVLPSSGCLERSNSRIVDSDILIAMNRQHLNARANSIV